MVLSLPSVTGATLLEMLIEACGVGIGLVAGRLCGSPPTAHVCGAAHILHLATQVLHQVDEPSQFRSLAGLEVGEVAMNGKLLLKIN